MKRTMTVIMAVLLCASMTGCGIIPGFLKKEKEPEIEESIEETQESAEPEQDEAAPASAPEEAETSGSGEIAHSELIGNWQMVCETDYSGKPGAPLDEVDSYFYMADEMGSMDLYIYEDDGALYADFEKAIYESSTSGYHLPLEIVSQPLYEKSSNQEWSANVMNPRTKEKLFSLTLEGDDKLVKFENDVYEEAEDPWFYATVATLLREGSPEMEQKEELRYNETITVSDADELLRAIDSGKKIILKEGEYDLSKANKKIKNPNVIINDAWNSDSTTVANVRIKEVENLCLMAEEGKKVEICISNPYDPVLAFEGCRYLTIEGITAGHHVEPGTCGGSVLQFRQSNKINLKDCSLYGCGTYGIEATDCSDLFVEDSEIYECTYGIVDLYSVYNANFTNCEMYKNKDMDMISLSQCTTITFTDCAFKDNLVDTTQFSTVNFVRASECYSVAFHKCEFTDNTYGKFNEGDVEIDNCSFKDKIVDSKD